MVHLSILCRHLLCISKQLKIQLYTTSQPNQHDRWWYAQQIIFTSFISRTVSKIIINRLPLQRLPFGFLAQIQANQWQTKSKMHKKPRQHWRRLVASTSCRDMQSILLVYRNFRNIHLQKTSMENEAKENIIQFGTKHPQITARKITTAQSRTSTDGVDTGRWLKDTKDQRLNSRVFVATGQIVAKSMGWK